MKIFKVFVALPILLLFSDCKKEDKPLPEIQHTLVLQGYLYAGMPAGNILIQSMDIGSSMPAVAIENASASILWNNVEFPLQNTPGKGGYYQVNDSNLQIIAGETYTIHVNYNNKVVSASTTIPPPVFSCTTDINSIIIAEGNTDYNAVHIAWQTPENFKTTLTILNMDELQNTPINSMDIDCTGYQGVSPFNTLLDVNVATITPCDFTHLGNHKLMLATINPEAEFLFQNSNAIGVGNDEGNIINGSGIFSSFNGYAFTIEVQ